MPSLPRLYAILDVDTLTARGLQPRAVLEAWLDAGIRLIQLRAKTMASGQLLALAEDLAGRARDAGATFIVNDRADIALLAGADGVHVGQGDLTPHQIEIFRIEIFRSRGASAPRSPFLIGLSTHTLDQLRDGLVEPANYLAIGPVFATSTKATPDPVVGLAMVREAARTAGNRPLVAIGGITLGTAPQVLEAGATSVAIISDLLVGDVGRRAREYIDAICQ